jgi:rhodanese-related sulfurtransferase
VKLKSLLYLIILLFIVGLTGCDDDSTSPDPVVNETEVILNFLENELNFPYGNFVATAENIRTTLLASPNSQYIVDIRSAADFATGHINGAVQVNFTDLYNHITGVNTSSYERVVLVCYSGQSAAYAAALLRAAGYANVFSMKWGMSGWHEDFAGPWLNNRSNARATQFVNTPAPAKPPKGELPEITTGFSEAVDIIDARVAELFTAGYTPATINHSSLYQNLSGYRIINFWPNNLYLSLGHIEGALNYPPDTDPWKSENDLMTLSTEVPNVIYCYTGQTSSYLAGYLRLLGYDARSLLYGGNAMIFDVMRNSGTANTFIPEAEIKNYDYVQ